MSPNQGFVPIELVARSGRAKQAEPTDPFIATAVSLATPGHDGVKAMGRTFVEEFAMLGWSRERVARMFTVRQYAGGAAVMPARGEAGVMALIAEVCGPSTPDGTNREAD